jgi:hypothetical protein
MIGIVCLFTIGFYIRNSNQKRGALLQNTVCSSFHCPLLNCDLSICRIVFANVRVYRLDSGIHTDLPVNLGGSRWSLGLGYGLSQEGKYIYIYIYIYIYTYRRGIQV